MRFVFPPTFILSYADLYEIEQELLTFLADVERLQKKVEDKKQEARAAKIEPPSTPVAAAA